MLLQFYNVSIVGMVKEMDGKAVDEGASMEAGSEKKKISELFFTG